MFCERTRKTDATRAGETAEPSLFGNVAAQPAAQSRPTWQVNLLDNVFKPVSVSQQGPTWNFSTTTPVQGKSNQDEKATTAPDTHREGPAGQPSSSAGTQVIQESFKQTKNEWKCEE